MHYVISGRPPLHSVCLCVKWVQEQHFSLVNSCSPPCFEKLLFEGAAEAGALVALPEKAKCQLPPHPWRLVSGWVAVLTLPTSEASFLPWMSHKCCMRLVSSVVCVRKGDASAK